MLLKRRVAIPFFLSPLAQSQQATTIFKGIPSLKISAGASERIEEKLSREQAVNLACVISKIGDRFYWASRENVELRRSAGGAFETYTAINGSGYIRIVSEAGLNLFDYGYVEHLLIMMSSVTYCGNK